MAWGAILRRINANQFYDLGSNVISFESSKTTLHAKLDIKGETYFFGVAGFRSFIWVNLYWLPMRDNFGV
jgi:hypothetical protein